jgi:hypothetical protein
VDIERLGSVVLIFDKQLHIHPSAAVNSPRGSASGLTSPLDERKKGLVQSCAFLANF